MGFVRVLGVLEGGCWLLAAGCLPRMYLLFLSFLPSVPYLTFLLPSIPFRAEELAMAMPKRLAVKDESPFRALSDELLFLILDLLRSDPLDVKSFSLVSRAFYAVESRHRRSLTPLRSHLLPSLLSHRYSSVSHLNLSLCPYLTDASLRSAASSLGPALRSIHLSAAPSCSRQAFHALADRCPNLEDLHVSNGAHLTDDVAVAIARMPNLHRLTLARCSNLTDLGIACIAVGCPHLRVLSFKACVALTDFGVAFLALKCTKLTSFDLSFTMITHKCLQAVTQMPNLQHLSITGCLGIDDDALLKHGSKSLQALHISNCQNVTGLGVSAILNNNSSLRHLDLSYSCPLDSVLPGLHAVSKLHSIKLDGCRVSTDGLKSLSNSTISFKELSFSKCSGVTDEVITAIVAKHKDLLKLDVTCCRNITDLSLAAITASSSSLLSLRMESCANVTCEGLRLIGRRCPKLEELDLTDNDLDDEGLKSLARCRNLKSLKIGLCLKITDEGLIQIAQSCPHLRELDLYRSIGITDKGVSEIARGCSNLETINMSYCTSISDESLKRLSKCTRLNTLEVRCCPLVSSAGISVIASGCRQLSKLDIKKCYDISDSAMLSLARFSHNLRQINLSYCSVTDVGVLALAGIGCLRVLTILHISGMTPNGLSMALLMCGSLMKIRLHMSFKPLISPVLIERVELRGCIFQWLNKPFQVELESSEVWKQQSHDIFVD